MRRSTAAKSAYLPSEFSALNSGIPEQGLNRSLSTTMAAAGQTSEAVTVASPACHREGAGPISSGLGRMNYHTMVLLRSAECAAMNAAAPNSKSIHREISLPHSDRDFITRPPYVTDPYRNGGTRQDSIWHPRVDLIQPRVSGDISEP